MRLRLIKAAYVWTGCLILLLVFAAALKRTTAANDTGEPRLVVVVDTATPSGSSIDGRDWLQFKGDAAKTGCTDETVAFPPALMWKHSSKPFYQNPAAAVAAGGRVCFCSGDLVYCLDAETGGIRWWQQVEGSVRATPALVEGLLCVPSIDGKMYSYRAESGAVEWIFPTNGPLRSSPLAREDKLYFGSNDDYLYCLSASDGGLVWKCRTGGDVMSGPAYSGGYIFFLSNDGNLYCVREKEGQVYWRSSMPGAGQLLSSPAVGSEYVWVTAGKALYGVRRRTGKVEFTITTDGSIIGSPVLTKEMVYAGSTDGYLYAVDTRSGRLRWKVKLGFPVLATPTIVGDYVLTGTEKGFVVALQAADGEVVWKYQIRTGTKTPNHVVAEPVVSRGSLYIVGDDGALYAFKPWGADVGEPVATEARIKLKSQDGSLVSYPLESSSRSEPNPVPRMCGVPPVIFSVTLKDEGSGIDESTLNVTLIAGETRETKKATYDAPSGLLEAELGPAVKAGMAVRPLPNGNYTILLTAKDWHGNELSREYAIIINNQLPRPRPAEKKEKPTDMGIGGIPKRRF